MIEQQLLKSTSQEGHSVRITQALLNFILTLIYSFFVLIAPAAHGVHIFLSDVSGFNKGTGTLASLSKTSEFSLKLRICFSSHIKKSILKDCNYFFQVLSTSKGSVVRQRAVISNI